MVYVDEETVPVTGDTVLVFGPLEYWAMNAELNVASEGEAVKFAPALFDLGEGYGFQAKKTGDKRYVLIAYEKDALSRKLRELPSVSEARRMTFAQWVFGDFERPIRLSNGKYLTTMDGIVVEIDPSYLDTTRATSLREALQSVPVVYKTLPIDELLPEKITPKTLKTTMAVLVILLGNLIAQAVMDHRTSEALQIQIDEMLEGEHLPATSIERSAIIDALKQKENKQIRLREQAYQLSTLPLNVTLPIPPAPSAPSTSQDVVLIPGSKPGEPNRLLIGGKENHAALGTSMTGIEELSYDGHSIKARIATKNVEEGESVKNDLQKRFKNARIEVQEHYIEVRLK